MGTVPDPLRSAKLLLVATSEERDCLGDPQSTKHQHKQASLERSSNGISYTQAESAGVCLFDLNCTIVSDIQRDELLCGDDTSQPDMFLPGSFSQAEEVPPACTESASDSEQKVSSDSTVQTLIIARTCAAGHATDMMPATHNSNQLIQSDLPRIKSLAQVDDCAVKVCRMNDSAELQELKYPSPDNTIKGSESCHHSSQANTLQRIDMEKEKAVEINDPGFSLAATPVRDFEAIPDLGIRPQVYSEAEIRAANDVKSCPTFRTALAQSNEALPPSSFEGTLPGCKAEMEKTGPVLPQLSRFREASTMTVQPESTSLTREAVNRTWRDAEVQAVASMETKSASTSPSILAAFLKGNPPSEATEQLHFIYQSGGGQNQSELADDFASLQEPALCPGIVPKVCALTVVMDTGKAQPAKLQKHQGDPPDTICPVLSGSTTPACLCPQGAGNTQGIPADGAETQVACLARDSTDIPQLPSAAAVLLRAKPVYQITVNTSNQPAAPQESGDGEPHPSPFAAVPEASNNFPHQVSDSESNQSPGHSRVPHGTEQTETLCSAAGSSTDRKPSQFQSVDEVQISLANVKTEREPKKEEKLMLLDSRGGVNTSTGAAAGSMKVYAPGTVKTEQDKMLEDTTQAKKSSSLSLQAGFTPELNMNSTHDPHRMKTPTAPPDQISKASETRKEPTAVPASAPLLPHLGEKKKKPTVATEAKVQVQQSKHIRDVVWDEQGMTWEVYGASLDPESLGIAIQNHLQRQIREHEKLIRAQSTQNRKSISSDTSSNKKLKGRQHNVFQSMLQNFRRPNCCIRPAPSSVLD
ncbi:G protein-regulated inducer of neurite outgrowth 3 [Mauremys reevesii]|uniref:G protein-regulated inducer of neurite outgrowth 3 n=1 Tax=Mauremys reevesii TaxID=260615 RepID=UPI00193F1F87|nr:G protein-regulated inducer of neurite outgrowth 3 [Mauremys reevesii]XP_039398029.1 G protein-regulated inducer of neurite outgrowth 3 [Mauremys reevesii]XP_039398030.1 G protein-regulated inducer of neurite outgrowth 3 [Mauremys reevesii]